MLTITLENGRTSLRNGVKQVAAMGKAFLLFTLLTSFFTTTALATGDPCGYVVKLKSSTYANGKTTFVWSVANPNPGNGYNGTCQDLSHFGIALPACVDLKDIVTSGCSPNLSYGIDKSQDCYTKPYLKFDFGTNSYKETLYTLVLNGKYTVASTTAIFKSGSRTGCCTKTVDGVGCKENPCTPPTCDLPKKAVICVAGSNAGSVVLTGPGGSGLSYLWTGPNGFKATTQQITVNSVGTPGPGIYTLKVTNTGGCSTTSTTEVVVGQKPVCSISGKDKICAGQSTSFTATGGTSYSWTGPNGFKASGATISNLTAPGTYTVTVTNDAGCSSTCSKDLSVEKVECKITGNLVIPTGGSTSLTASGGATYLWTGPNGFTATTATINNITVAGEYKVTVTGANGCSCSCSVKVTTTPPPAECNFVVKLESLSCVLGKTVFVWSVYNPTPTSCKDLSHFGIVLPPCVDPKDIITYSCSPNLSYGIDKSQTCYTKEYLKFDYGTSYNKKTYYVLVLDGKYTTAPTTAIFKYGTTCCTKTVDGIGCKEVPCVPPTCSITGKPICNDGSTTGSTTLTATGGVSYKWTGPNGFTATGAVINVSTPGTYTVEVTNAGGCKSTCSKEVNVSFAPKCSITGNNIICTDGSNANSTTLKGPDGSGYTYSWTGPNGFKATTQQITVYSNGFNGASPGVYYLTVTNADGCSSTCSIEVVVKVIPDCSLYTVKAKGTSAITESSNFNFSGNLAVATAPNPFRDKVRFVIQSKVSGQGVLEVFNTIGVKVKTVFQGYVQAGKEQVVEFSASGAPRGSLVYRMQVGAEQVTGKLVSTN